MPSFFNKAQRDWNKAWIMKLTPWELKGRTTPALAELFQSEKIISLPQQYSRALVPGCGSGLDCIFLSNNIGFSEVIGLDISKKAIEIAKTNLTNGQLSKNQFNNQVTFIEDDFFKWKSNVEISRNKEEKFDFIFDYLFFSAIEPIDRKLWAQKMSSVLKKKTGILATLMFPLLIDKTKTDPKVGPPYHVSMKDYSDSLEPLGFELIYSSKEVNSIEQRKGREMMALWKIK
jgi:hypothetical protein